MQISSLLLVNSALATLRQHSETDRLAYIKAVLCLANETTTKSGIPGVTNRFEDHLAVHHNQTPNIHWVGHFLLWHRYFVATYEKALRDECGWTGGQPYWDWSLDAEPANPNSTRIFDSRIFDSYSGFGGNGDKVVPTADQNPINITGGTGGGCVQNGPFVPSAFMLNFPTTDCLRRDFDPPIMNSFADPKLVTHVLAQKDYTSFAKAVENVPSMDQPNIHGSGHFGVGGALGTIGNAANSPGDPLFYLHHANLDRIFWQWQQMDLTTRLDQVGGPVVPLDYSGTNVTLDFTINIGNLAGNATLKDVLDTTGGTLCYTY
ncbi:monooxygenase [Pleomassaria siparia CBS 279.74]|uniref:Monooxygenase n=1 Tax=Pleomassaria siparia CBS 279.74 TaxID=1314801 RepID=A0A6G1KL30_9PLEO|nr:monooxygenase [Pleomassaria siparia CBS 279.74]